MQQCMIYLVLTPNNSGDVTTTQHHTAYKIMTKMSPME